MKNKKIFLRFIFSIFLYVSFFCVQKALASENLSRITNEGGIVYFADDYENGYQYMGSSNPHSGGGYYQLMGGSVAKPEGIYTGDGTPTGCVFNTSNYHYTLNSSELVAQNATAGSQKSLKTPYLGVCPGEGFIRDTTVIQTPLLSEYYVRWYQKWTGSFEASVQEKFVKFYNSANLNEKTITGHLTMRPNNPSGTTPGATTGLFEEYAPNIDGHYNKGACILSDQYIWIQPDPIAYNDCYAGQARGYDDSVSTNIPINLNLDQWYEIEIHSKLNSDPAVADAVYEVWIDGVLRLEAHNFKFKNGFLYNTPGTNNFEFQHVYYDRSNSDQSTYMDNIVIANKRIGPVIDVIAPSAPTGLGVI